MKSPFDKLLNTHQKLVHSENQKVVSHVQRDIKIDGVDWSQNTVMIDGCEAPFKFKRKQAYQNLKGSRVNLTYYRAVENIAGIEMEVMNVVRIKKT